MIVTTARKQASRLEQKAKEVANKLSSLFIERKDASVTDMIKRYQTNVIVVGKGRLTLYPADNGDPFFYHPSSAMFRVKQWSRGGSDPFIDVAALKKGMSMVDCTLGLASDSLVAKLAVGVNGRVIGLEANPVVAYIVQEGLQTWQEGSKEMIQRMREIEVIHIHHLTYLQSAETSSIDVVYFDPMFEVHVETSTGIKGLKSIACHDDLNEEILYHAKRVAKSRVVIKDHWQSERFERFGFNQVKRQHAAFHYGSIDVSTK
ncbi:class I SAM-dependent methyltransferase [Alkalihalophilus sp. As8PL]|uniref:Class I SAM-dependent methyltransferase n=1 Tax=Alkalihalophilus sp. As8PL TaxID=3237103 RepID=A0AB39BSZ1_9BACI